MTPEGRSGSGSPADSGPPVPPDSSERDEGRGAGDNIPLGQKLYDSPFLLLVAGVLIMFISFTGWGLWEILSLPPAPLP